MPVIILTKTDKQKTYVTNANAAVIRKTLDYQGDMIPFSVQSASAKDRTWALIESLLKEC
jgi:GTP-binding protein EngB required for normal cell division